MWIKDNKSSVYVSAVRRCATTDGNASPITQNTVVSLVRSWSELPINQLKTVLESAVQLV